MSGTSTMRSGFRIFAVSAMKCTPANTMTSACVFFASCASCERVADEVGQVLDLALLVVVGEQDRVALLLEPDDFLVDVEAGEIGLGERCVRHGARDL